MSDSLAARPPIPPDDGSLEGALVIDKPQGLTSHDVIAALRRALREPRIGHTGTLDPLATGVLPVLLGRATRLARFLSNADKIYEARVRLTCETDTDDETGKPLTGPTDRRTDRAHIEEALTPFRGSLLQMPPAYSAKKIAGRRAYALARQALPPALVPVPVTVHQLELLDWQEPVATLRVACSAGFYVRALARDLGRALGTGGHLAALRREASGRFVLSDAVPLEAVLQDPEIGRRRLLAPGDALEHLPAVRVSDEELQRVRHGGDVDLAADAGPLVEGAPHVRLVGPDGALVGIAAPGARPRTLHPVVVLM